MTADNPIGPTAIWRATRSASMAWGPVMLRAIAPSDRDGLAAIAFDPGIWRFFVQRIERPGDLDEFVSEGVRDTHEGRRAVFCICERATGAIVGSTAFGNFSPVDRRVEIGWSWLGEAYRGNGFNKPAKFLMLRHAFDRLKCERVEFKTDILNEPACRALEAIGATHEGIFRSYNVMPGGRRRDAAWYSIIAAEWPAVHDRLVKA